jgi:diguanylate cyclase (GGDEF)-like protein
MQQPADSPTRRPFFDRYDAFLIAGFTIALIVVFARPIRYALDVARQVEDTYGLALLPALIILTVVFLFQQQAKRQEAHAQVVAAAAEARQALDRARELEMLVAFGQSLARSLDLESVREVVLRHLPQLVGCSEVWVLVRMQGGWEGLMGATQMGRLDRGLEAIADMALGDAAAAPAGGLAIEREGQICVPMVAGGTSVGVLGVATGSILLADGRRRMLAACAAVLAIAVRNVQLFAEVRQNSLHDGLTRCVNRTHGLEVLDAELQRARRTTAALSVILLDIDHFKDINDRFGHLCGDAVLAAVGRRIREVLRASDVKCRYGGEEFLVILPDTAEAGGRRVAETLRVEVGELQVPWNGEMVRVTASLGLAIALVGELDGQALLARADVALYAAKKQGRNRVVLAEETIKPELPATQPSREPLAFTVGQRTAAN